MVRARLRRFFLQIDRAPVGIKRHHPIAPSILDPVGKHRGPLWLRTGLLQQRRQPMAIKHIVPQHQRRRSTLQKLLGQHQRLGNAFGTGLRPVVQTQAPLLAITQQPGKARQVFGGGNQQDLADPGQHQHTERVIHHRFVVQRQQLLGHHLRGGIQPGAGATGQQDAASFGNHGNNGLELGC